MLRLFRGNHHGLLGRTVFQLAFAIWSRQRSQLYWSHRHPRLLGAKLCDLQTGDNAVGESWPSMMENFPKHTFLDSVCENLSFSVEGMGPLLRPDTDAKHCLHSGHDKKCFVHFQLKIWKFMYVSFIIVGHYNLPATEVQKYFPTRKLLILIKEVLKWGSFYANCNSV